MSRVLRRPVLLPLLALLVLSGWTGYASAHLVTAPEVGAHPSTFQGYNVTFRESGLPFGTSWSVTCNGTTLSGNFPRITVPMVGNGTWPWSVAAVTGYSANPSSGTVTVMGSNPASISIAFTPLPGHYTVTFTENGLPFTATGWNVTFNNTVYASNGFGFTGPTITITGVVNGTYAFSVLPQYGLFPTPASGTIIVSGPGPGRNGAYTQNIAFGPPPGHYTVTFTETGLPFTATTWNVTFNNTVYAANGFGFGGPTITIPNVVNGSYAFSVAAQYGLFPTPASGTIVVNGPGPGNGGSYSQNIAFAGIPPGMYPVYVNETGLSGAPPPTWWVVLGGLNQSTTGSSLVFPEANGNYAYTLGAPFGWTATPASGSVTVSGGSKALAITFTQAPPSYKVSFQESGLVSGTAWAVTLQGTVRSSSTPWVNFTGVADGSYNYNISNVYRWAPSPPSGSITVSGAAQTLQVAFTEGPATYAVTFTSSGIPASTSWSVTFDGTSLSGQAGNLVFNGIANSTTSGYAFTVGAVAGYVANPASGNLVVSGPASQTISFTQGSSTKPLYTVTFAESGLPSGKSWSIVFNGSTLSSATPSQIVFDVHAAAGLTYSVGTVSGYTSNPSSGTLNVAGNTTVPAIVFTSSGSKSSGLSGALSGPTLYAIVALVAVVAALLVAFLVMRRRKAAGGRPSATETYAEGSSSSAGSSWAASHAATDTDAPPAPTSDDVAPSASPSSGDLPPPPTSDDIPSSEASTSPPSSDEPSSDIS
ncbi:MAG: hypothetical protein KGJ23_09595 [Euryarchaeota archaeon]|nr:hypothetical protein [Euryarchaeota archaeon]MDE1879734.1 hypothetical protein [Euryarchaeota archaeon]MDE2046043.1 hypothetical protein [Thermoplasmata archaeon]